MEIPFYKGCALIRESSIKAITRVIKDAVLAVGLSVCVVWRNELVRKEKMQLLLC